MKKTLLLLLSISLIAISMAGVIAFSPGISISEEPPPPAIGDGYLLKRSQSEICHSCHKTNVNTPSTDANWNYAIKMHSAEILGACGNTTYKTKTECEDPLKGNSTWTAGEWNASGGWGVSGGKYGEFLCTTCHTAHDTKNIYLIKEAVTSPNSPTDDFPCGANSPIDFWYKVAATGDSDPAIGKMGKPNEARSSSSRVCEVCHTYNLVSASDGVTVHAYNMPATLHMGTTTCTVCHSHKTGFSGAGCDGCHDSPPTIGKHAIHFGSGSVDYGSTTIQSIQTQYRFSCGICHNGAHNNSVPPNPRTVQVIFAGVAIQDPASGSATYTPAANSTDDPGYGYTFNYSDGTCSNVYCHGNYPGSGKIASPTFTTGTAACGTCHGVYDAANTTDYPASGNHERHVTATDTIGNAYNREYQCTLCHNGIVTGVTSYTIADKSKHVSGYVDWKFDTTDSRLQGGFESYSITTGTVVPSDGTTPREYGTCNNVYCHSIVQTADGSALTGAEGEYMIPAWGSPPSTCNCHNADAGEIFGHTPVEISSGSHAKHLTYTFNSIWAPDVKGTLCTICHKWNASATYDDCDQCHLTTEEKTYHVNGAIDVSFDTYWGNGTYNGGTAPGNGYSSCSSTYCHGNYPGSGLNAIPTWGNSGSGACGTCHGAQNTATSYPNSGSHERHVTATDTTGYTKNREYTCTLCHVNVVSGGTASYTIIDKSKHVNKYVDWQFDTTEPASRVSESSAYSYTSGTEEPSDGITREYGTCSNVYCHSIVQKADGSALTGAEGEYIPPTWGSPSTCNCHDADAGEIFGHTPVEISSGSHAKHLTYTFNSIWAPDVKGTLCTICHKWNASATYDDCDQCHLTTEEKTYHVNGAIDVSFDTYFGNGTYNGASNPGNGYSNCSNTYCHSNGTGGTTQPGETRSIADNTSANWGGFTTCESCHGGEVVGSSGRPSYDNFPAGPKANSHSAHSAYTCNYCHVNTTSDGTTIADKEYHVNRYYDVDADAGAGVSFTYTYSPTGGTCSSISIGCHAANRTWGVP